MTIAGFAIPPGGEPLSRSTRDWFKNASDRHAVQIVGYEIDPATNQVSRWKILNSWGSQVGDRGIFHMYRDFFETFGREVSFIDNGTIPLPRSKHWLTSF